MQLSITGKVSPRLIELAEEAEQKSLLFFPELERTRRSNFYKVIASFQKAGVSEACLKGSSGYGLGDFGREALEAAFAFALDSQDALVRLQIVSGTHAIALALLSHLHKGDKVVCLNGKPYNSLLPTFDFLRNSGVRVEINGENQPPLEFAQQYPDARVFFLQRSLGYQQNFLPKPWDLREVVIGLKQNFPGSLVIVDNCYGEFVREKEPTAYGADLICGSLIKNPGGGLALGGGYIAGKAETLEEVLNRLFAPGLGKELSATEGQLRSLFQGLFFAPFTVCEALKGAIFFSHFFQALGFQVHPGPEEPREDIVQAILLGSKEKLLAFSRGIQKASALDFSAIPIPQRLPGYEEEIIMAGGTFVSGASLELSFDGPVNPPYIGYVQAGVILDHAVLGAVLAAQELLGWGLLPKLS
jgi:cystathionine beta-lyase family protein involved in aluminum resistance